MWNETVQIIFKGVVKCMHGYVISIEESCKYPFRFKNGTITIYNRDAILVDNTDKYKINFKCEVNYLVAEDIDTNKTLIFFISDIPFTSDSWNWVSSESIRVYYYLELKYPLHNFLFNKLVFEFPELNFFYPVINGFKSEHNESSIFTVEPIPFQQTKQIYKFKLNGESVDLEFGVLGVYHFRSSAPLTFSSQLSCSFRETNSIGVLINIYQMIQRLFYFLCHRRSIRFESVKVKCIDNNGKYTLGELYVLFDNKETEDEDVVKETIRIDYVKSHLNQLIQHVANDSLYIDNIPRDSESAHHITTASFILEAAAFEWSFKKLYGAVKPSEYRLAVKQDLLKALDELKCKTEYNSKKKGEVKYYSKIIKNTERSFSEKVLYALREFDDILSAFIQRVYKYNNLTYDKKSYNKIADELQNYRNAFAHGDIDKEMKGEFILDTIILEWLNYCIVLKTVGYDNDEIFNIINIIFDRKFTDR